MKIIISGTIDLDPERLTAALEAGRPFIKGALTQEGCLAYDWCPEPTTPGRIRVFECWQNEAALARHFKNEHYLNMRDCLGEFGLLASDVRKYRVDLEEPVYDETLTPRADFFTLSQ